MAQIKLAFSTWIQIADGADAPAARFYEAHYSSEKSMASRLRSGTNFILGPGQKMLLVTPDRLAMFGWRKFINDGGEQGINCAVFRNAGQMRSSDLIRAADDMADARWPGERHYTYVNAKRIASRNPGYCFKRAGWRLCGVTKARKLLILERQGN